MHTDSTVHCNTSCNASLPKATFSLTPLQWALCHFSLLLTLKFLKLSLLFLPSCPYSVFSACPSSSQSCISSLISTRQIYSFNFPTNMRCFQVCTTSGGAGTRGLSSRVALINSRPLPGMTNFPSTVTKKYDTPFVPPSGSYDRLANQSSAGLNLLNF